jgi:recombination protein RecR
VQYSSRHLEVLVREVARLPGIGHKTAQRLAFHLLRIPREEALDLARAIERVRTDVGVCEMCGNISETQPCYLCGDARRDRALLCVVEEPSDVIVLERTGQYRGLYHVLRGALSPIEGQGPEEIGLDRLLARIADGDFAEVILATNPTTEGEATAHAIRERLATLPVRVTRIARGVPVGSDLELADQVTLSRALEGRKEF